MYTANLDLCKELFELSEWNDPSLDHEHVVLYSEDGSVKQVLKEAGLPRYDLGYLLRKLPPTISLDGAVSSFLMEEISGPASQRNVGWNCGYVYSTTYEVKIEDAPTPEDAVCMLAIRLFEQGILKRDILETVSQ